MRKGLSLLLALVLLSTLWMAAFAEEPVIEAMPDEEIASVEEAVSDEAAEVGDVDLYVPEGDALAPEGVEPNATVPTKLILGVGETCKLDISGVKKYKSSNKKIASVSKKGVIKGVKVGSATITVTPKKGAKVKIKVTVRKAPTKVTLNKSKLAMEVGDTFRLKATLSKKSASKLTWSSSKSAVAQVSDAGVITAVSAGKAVITVKTYKKKVLAKCTVEVKSPAFKVGVSLPTDALERWEFDGICFGELLKEAGYTVDLQYAGNKESKQSSQIEAMIEGGCNVLIVAAVNGGSLGTVLKKAAKKNIPVIAYDRLIMNSDAVSFYVTYGNYQVGAVQGEFVRDALKLDSAKGPFYIEFTAGDPNDGNALLFYQGAYDVLSPYIKSGKLVVRSGQTRFSDAATGGWMPDNAQARAEDILADCYAGGEKLDAWLCSNDSTAQGVIAALSDNYTGKWPVITGQDCDMQNVRYIIKGRQAMSVFKDTFALVERAVKMADQIIKGKKVTVNDEKSCDNGKKVVPAYLLKPSFVTVDNYEEVLIDTGIYRREDLEG